MSNSI